MTLPATIRRALLRAERAGSTDALLAAWRAIRAARTVAGYTAAVVAARRVRGACIGRRTVAAMRETSPKKIGGEK